MRIALLGCAVFFAVQMSACSAALEPFQASSGETREALPTLTPRSVPSLTPTAICREGELFEVTIPSSAMQKNLDFLVYLPACLEEDGEYPLLILLHGQQYDEHAWVNFGVIDLADEWIAAGRTGPFIMVFPFEENFVMEPYEEHYGDAIVKDLIPFLEENYPVCMQACCRAIGGFSRGAAWAVWTGLNYQGVFGAVGAHSFTPFAGDHARTPTWLREFGEMPFPELFVDSGEDDPFLPGARQYVEVLEQFDVPLQFIVRAGDHSESYWTAHTAEYLEWYLMKTENR